MLPLILVYLLNNIQFEILIHFLRNNIIYLVETFTAISINMEFVYFLDRGDTYMQTNKTCVITMCSAIDIDRSHMKYHQRTIESINRRENLR